MQGFVGSPPPSYKHKVSTLLSTEIGEYNSFLIFKRSDLLPLSTHNCEYQMRHQLVRTLFILKSA